jgi:hypothetical protein
MSIGDTRLDVGPIAYALAKSIVEGLPDNRLVRRKDGSVALKIGEIIPATDKQKTLGRRKRLRSRLGDQLRPHGWREIRPNVYRHD